MPSLSGRRCHCGQYEATVESLSDEHERDLDSSMFDLKYGWVEGCRLCP